MIDWLTKMAERHGVDAGWSVAILAAAVAVWQWADKHLREHYRDTIEDRDTAIGQRDDLVDSLSGEVDRLTAALQSTRDELQSTRTDAAQVAAFQDAENARLHKQIKSLRSELGRLRNATPPTPHDAWEQ